MIAWRSRCSCPASRSATTWPILQTQAVAGIAALGMTLTAVVGDLDLSVGAAAGFSVTVAAVAMVG